MTDPADTQETARQLGYLFGWYTKPAAIMDRTLAFARFGAPQHMIVEVVQNDDGTVGDLLASCTSIEAATAAARLISGTAVNLYLAAQFGHGTIPRDWKPPVGFRKDP